MSSENENKTVQLTPEEDYAKNFVPRVHKVGRIMAAFEIVLCLTPVFYIVFIRGEAMPLSSYIGVFLSVAPMMLLGWLTEPMTYWPTLGSAGTYMSYFAGNVSTVRFPVAVTVQQELRTNINTPRGQVATIVGIAASVPVCLIFLLIIIFSGEWLLSILPESVFSSFDFTMVAVIGCMLTSIFAGQFAKRSDGTRDVKGGLLNIVCYSGSGILLTMLISAFLPSLAGYSMFICIIAALVIAYIRYRADLKKARSAA